MSQEQLLSLMGFVTVMVGTPGPNNLMLLASGANFGFRRSLPHILGITLGCQVLLLAVAFGVGGLLQAAPGALVVLQVLGVGFLLYLAWLLTRVRALGEARQGQGRPLSFMQAALFQWVNPKAWMMSISAMASFSLPGDFTTNVVIIAAAFLVLGLPLITLWNLFGTTLREWLGRDGNLLWFNRVMAVLLLGSLYPILAGY